MEVRGHSWETNLPARRLIYTRDLYAPVRELAAEAAGKTDVAVAAYEALAASQPGLDGEFYRSRAEALGGGKTAPVKDGAENK